MQRCLINDLGQTLSECVGDIIYIETNRHKNVFYTTGQTYSIYKKMGDEISGSEAAVYAV